MEMVTVDEITKEWMSDYEDCPFDPDDVDLEELIWWGTPTASEEIRKHNYGKKTL